MHQYSAHDVPGHSIAFAHVQTELIPIQISIYVMHLVAIDVGGVS